MSSVAVKRALLRRLVPSNFRAPMLRTFVSDLNPWVDDLDRLSSVFIHVPKSAGSSIKTEMYGSPKFGHRRISAYYDYDPFRTDRFFKFCFVRNPWDRFVSSYQYLTLKKDTTASDDQFTNQYLAQFKSFSAFVSALSDPKLRGVVLNQTHFRPQHWWICLPGHNVPYMNFVGKFERFDADMQYVRTVLKLPQKETVKVRVSEHDHYREYYDTQQKEFVGNLYGRDCTMFGYEF